MLHACPAGQQLCSLVHMVEVLIGPEVGHGHSCCRDGVLEGVGLITRTTATMQLWTQSVKGSSRPRFGKHDVGGPCPSPICLTCKA